MGRGKVELKRIENKISRQVTFSKRRSGLLKKANEISVLCDSDVALIVFSTKGKLYQYSSHSNMDKIIERYERDSCMDKNPTKISEQKEDWCVELPKLLSRIELLQRNIRNCMGEDLDNLSLRELQNLQHQLDTGLKRLRTRKNQLMIESISQLQKKERSLQDQNNLLGKQVKQKGKQQIVEHTQECGLAQTSTSILPNPTPPSLITCGGAHSSKGVEDGSNIQALPPKLNNHIPPWLFRHLSQL